MRQLGASAGKQRNREQLFNNQSLKIKFCLLIPMFLFATSNQQSSMWLHQGTALGKTNDLPMLKGFISLWIAARLQQFRWIVVTADVDVPWCFYTHQSILFVSRQDSSE